MTFSFWHLSLLSGPKDCSLQLHDSSYNPDYTRLQRDYNPDYLWPTDTRLQRFERLQVRVAGFPALFVLSLPQAPAVLLRSGTFLALGSASQWRSPSK